MLTNKEQKNFMQLAADYTPRRIARLLSEDMDCDNCPIKDKCPVGKEYDEMDKYGWYKEPENSCLDTMEHYILTGMIRDKRREKKDDSGL